MSAFVLAGSLNAQWELLDDFEDGNLDGWTDYQEPDTASVLPTNMIVDDPFGLNQGGVFELTHGVQVTDIGTALNQTLSFAIPAAQQIVADLTDQTKVSTFYFKVGRPTVGGAPAEVDTVFSLASTQNSSETDPPLYYSQGSVIARYEKDGGIDYYDDSTYIPTGIANETGPPNDTNTYYEIWYVVNHSKLAAKGEFDIYIQGGTDFPTQTKLTGDTPALYRSAATDPLDTFTIITSTGNDAEKGKDPIYFDDFYIDNSGENLTSPTGGIDTTGIDVKFVNIATRGLVGANAGEELIAGFVLLGDNPQQVLIRALGPDLTDRGVAGVLSDPTFRVVNFGGTEVATNDDWGNATDNADVADAIAEASSDPSSALEDGSTDAAILVTLAPNDVYTVVVSSQVAGESGVALVEVFEMGQ